MNTLNDWVNCAKSITEFLRTQGLKVRDFYLVGSKVRNINKSSDFDSIIITDSELTLVQLRSLRSQIDSFLKERNTSELFHYKLFSHEEFLLFQIYDGFRLADFKRRNVSLYNSNLIENSKPVLNQDSFCNSFLIQVVYNYFKFYQTLNFDKFHKRLMFWLEFNKSLSKDFQHVNNFEYFTGSDILIREFWEFVHEERGEMHREKISKLLNQYYNRIRHEYINKSLVYGSVLNSLKYQDK